MAVVKVSKIWRQRKAEEKVALESGEISADECCMEELFPDAFIDRVDKVLREFADAIARCSTSQDGYPSVMKSIEIAVRGLNEINGEFDGSAIETGEREELCEYIDAVIAERGIDVAALAASQERTRWELTDPWREW